MVSFYDVIIKAHDRGVALDSIVFSDVEICSACDEILFADDEAYESKEGKMLCDKCSCLCELCNGYVKESDYDFKERICNDCKGEI